MTEQSHFIEFHSKCPNKVTDKAFDMVLDLLREVVPNWKQKLPESF